MNSALAKLISGSVVSQVIPIMLMPILTRIYSPDQFGGFTIYISIVTLVTIVSSLRYEQALLIETSKGDLGAVYSLSEVALFLVSLISFMLGCVLLYINNTVDVLLCSVAILFSALQQLNLVLLNRLEMFGDIAKTRIILSTSIVVGQVLLGLLEIDQGLMLGYIISHMIAFLTMPSIIKGYTFSKFTRQDLCRVFLRHRDLAIYSMPAALMNTASTQIPVMMIGNFYGSAVAGQYGLSNRMVNVPLSVLGSSVGQYYSSRIANSKNDTVEVVKTSKSTIKKLTFSGAMLFIPLVIISPWLFPILFGEDWLMAGNYTSLLSVWYFSVFVISPISSVVTIFERHKQYLVFNVLLLLTRLLVFPACSSLGMPAQESIFIFSVSGALLWIIFLLSINKIVKLLDSRAFFVIALVSVSMAILADIVT